ncbi:MAG: ABC transporter permease [Lachnospiraceae bacterium]
MSRRTAEHHEPLLRIVKRDSISNARQWRIRAIAFICALLTGALVILCLGHNPLAVYVDMVVGALGTPTVQKETVKIIIPLLITALGISIAFKMQFWNIGAEGQVLIGAVFAGYFAFFWDGLPKPLLILLMILAGAVGGGLYGLLPAFFKSRWGTNETLFTLMLNYIALSFVKYLQNGPWKAPQSQFPKMAMLSDNARLTKIFGVQWGWILALVLVVAMYIYMNKTKQGYEIAVVGESVNTARYAGMNVGYIIRRTMFFSGAIAGVAGMLQMSGSDYTITEGTAGGVGFTAITVAWLAKMNPYAMLIVAAFIAILDRGSNKIQTTFKIPASASEVLTGILLFFMLGCEFFINYRILTRKKREEAAA